MVAAVAVVIIRQTASQGIGTRCMRAVSTRIAISDLVSANCFHGREVLLCHVCGHTDTGHEAATCRCGAPVLKYSVGATRRAERRVVAA